MARGKNLTKEQQKEIIEKYKAGGVTCADIGREYNKDRGAIASLLKKNGVHVIVDPANLQRKFHFNQNYFNCIDTESKSYFLGFLYGDGYHFETNGQITIELSEVDIDILNKFKTELELDKPIFIREPRKTSTLPTKHCILNISSRIMSNDLINLGMRQNKTFTLQFPTEEQVPKHLLRHFCRGLYDADGSFSLTITPGPRGGSVEFQSCLVVSEDCCNGLGKVIEEELDIKYYICKPNKKNTNLIRNFNVWTTARTYKLIEWLYKDSTISLDRKYKKYLNIKNTLLALNLV